MPESMGRSAGIFAIACVCGITSGMFGIGGGGGAKDPGIGGGGTDTAYGSAGADGIREGRIRVLENRVAADPRSIFGQHRRRDFGKENQSAKDAAGFCGDTGIARCVAGAGGVVALGTVHRND